MSGLVLTVSGFCAAIAAVVYIFNMVKSGRRTRYSKVTNGGTDDTALIRDGEEDDNSDLGSSEEDEESQFLVVNG